MTWARVVLPTPGGPQKIMEETMSCWMMRRSTIPSPKRCCWPTTSSMVRGRSRAGSISTKPAIVKAAKEQGLLAVQRFFLLDSLALANFQKYAETAPPRRWSGAAAGREGAGKRRSPQS